MVSSFKQSILTLAVGSPLQRASCGCLFINLLNHTSEIFFCPKGGANNWYMPIIGRLCYIIIVVCPSHVCCYSHCTTVCDTFQGCMKTLAISTTCFSSMLHVCSMCAQYCFATMCFFCKVSFCGIDPQFLGSYTVLSVTMSATRELGINLAESAKERRLQ